MFRHFLFVTCLFVYWPAIQAGSNSTIQIRGIILCTDGMRGGVRDSPQFGVAVELWEEDGQFGWLDPHDFLGATLSWINGKFVLQARVAEWELDGEEYFLIARHHCSNGAQLDPRCEFVTKKTLDAKELGSSADGAELQVRIGRYSDGNGTKTTVECRGLPAGEPQYV